MKLTPSACSLFAGLALAHFAAAQGTFQPLGLYSGGVVGTPNSFATSVSADGNVIAGFAMGTDPGTHLTVTVALYRSGSGAWQAIPDTGYATPGGVSADGATIAGTGPLQIPGGAFAPFVYHVGGQTTALNLPSARFNAISGDGLTAVGSSLSSAILWTQSGGMQTLGHIPGWNGAVASAAAASADGSVIVGSDTATSSQAFVYTPAGGMQGLGFLNNSTGSQFSEARAVSADGSAVVGRSTNANGLFQPYIWRSGIGMRPLSLLDGATSGSANAVSADGSVVVGDSSVGSTTTAYYWDRARGRRDLRELLTSLGATGLTNWTLTTATAISPDGTIIVGEGIDPQGRSQAWSARIPAFCYVNCDGSAIPPIINIADFTCFLSRFAAGDAYANCDNSTTTPTLNVGDFICFQTRFASGCP